MKLSIVDLATVAPGTTEVDALADAVTTARHADAVGIHRVWFAEHHATPAQASHHPELLIAAVAAQTTGIRVGSGSVLLNHYSPFKVAEMFKQLEAMFPGRIDLGIGRATGGQVIDAALRPDRASRPVDDHQARVSEVLAWLYEAFPADHPFAGQRILPSVSQVPHTWLLGSSPSGSMLAAGLGMGYCFAGFINPPGATIALRTYREHFANTGFGPAEPRAVLAVNVTVGETTQEAERLVASVKAYYGTLMRGGSASMVPAADEALASLTAEQRAEPTSIVDGAWPRFVAGGPDEVKVTLDRMLEESGADELMVQNLIPDPVDRRRSHAHLAEMFGIVPRDAALGAQLVDHR